MGRLLSAGASPSSMNRYLATLRSVLAHAVADQRATTNAAATVKPPSGSHARREGHFLTVDELRALARACSAPYADVVMVLGLAGLRWGELAGLQVGDLILLPDRRLRLQRSVLRAALRVSCTSTP